MNVTYHQINVHSVDFPVFPLKVNQIVYVCLQQQWWRHQQRRRRHDDWYSTAVLKKNISHVFHINTKKEKW